MSFQPSYPYLFFHPNFIVKQGAEPWHYQVEESHLRNNIFEKGVFAIDVNCRKFSLSKVVERRQVYAWWNLPFIRREKTLYVDYIFGMPEQLSFDQARSEFVEYVCDHRWWSASYENQEQFRIRNASYNTMTEVIGPVSLKGSWPKVKRD